MNPDNIKLMPPKKALIISPNSSIYKPYFQVRCQLDKLVRTSKSYWRKITQVKHPRLRSKTLLVKDALRNSDLIRQSKSDKKVYLYYRKQNKHYLCVVVKHLNGDGFIITSYFTSKILEGKIIWTKK